MAAAGARAPAPAPVTGAAAAPAAGTVAGAVGGGATAAAGGEAGACARGGGARLLVMPRVQLTRSCGAAEAWVGFPAEPWPVARCKAPPPSMHAPPPQDASPASHACPCSRDRRRSYSRSRSPRRDRSRSRSRSRSPARSKSRSPERSRSRSPARERSRWGPAASSGLATVWQGQVCEPSCGTCRKPAARALAAKACCHQLVCPCARANLSASAGPWLPYTCLARVRLVPASAHRRLHPPTCAAGRLRARPPPQRTGAGAAAGRRRARSERAVCAARPHARCRPPAVHRTLLPVLRAAAGQAMRRPHPSLGS